jgi:hypothetical protein
MTATIYDIATGRPLRRVDLGGGFVAELPASDPPPREPRSPHRRQPDLLGLVDAGALQGRRVRVVASAVTGTVLGRHPRTRRLLVQQPGLRAWYRDAQLTLA